MKFVNLEVFEVIRRLGYPGDGREAPTASAYFSVGN